MEAAGGETGGRQWTSASSRWIEDVQREEGELKLQREKQKTGHDVWRNREQTGDGVWWTVVQIWCPTTTTHASKLENYSCVMHQNWKTSHRHRHLKVVGAVWRSVALCEGRWRCVKVSGVRETIGWERWKTERVEREKEWVWEVRKTSPVGINFISKLIYCRGFHPKPQL